MSFYLQDPYSDGTPLLHEAILEQSQSSIAGGAIFAFASRVGIKLLFEDKEFTKFLRNARFTLIVGVDETTNVGALTYLKEQQEKFKNLYAYVFIHDEAPLTFHPKFVWFSHDSGGSLIVGSGNLTQRGFRENWEAFTISQLKVSEFREFKAWWDRWLSENQKALRCPGDPEALSRAALNVWISKPGSRKRSSVDKSMLSQRPSKAAPVLIAEIPKGSDRWNQANFDIATYTQFFGMKPGASRRVILRHVGADGKLGEIENRPGVSVKSQNYRIELHAAANLVYPKAPPIAVFVKYSKRNFRYRLIMPDNDEYSVMTSFLESKAPTEAGNRKRLRRIPTNVATLERLLPASPIVRTLSEIE